MLFFWGFGGFVGIFRGLSSNSKQSRPQELHSRGVGRVKRGWACDDSCRSPPGIDGCNSLQLRALRSLTEGPAGWRFEGPNGERPVAGSRQAGTARTCSKSHLAKTCDYYPNENIHLLNQKKITSVPRIQQPIGEDDVASAVEIGAAVLGADKVKIRRHTPGLLAVLRNIGHGENIGQKHVSNAVGRWHKWHLGANQVIPSLASRTFATARTIRALDILANRIQARQVAVGAIITAATTPAKGVEVVVMFMIMSQATLTGQAGKSPIKLVG